MSTRTGSCLCGGVKVVIRGEPVSINACHCTSCQKFSGATSVSLAAFKTSDITFSESEPSIMKTYEDTGADSGRIVKRLFCGRCGSSLCGIRVGLDEFSIVPIGILDGDKSDLKPQFEFFGRSKVSWVAPVEGSQFFEALPPGF